PILIKKIKIKGTIKVAPVPPKSPTKFPKFSVNAKCGCSPFLINCKLASVFPYRAEDKPGFTTDGPWTPTNQNIGINSQIIANPKQLSAPSKSGESTAAITCAKGTPIKFLESKSITAAANTEKEKGKTSLKF